MAVAYVRDAGLKVAAGFSGTTNGSFATLPAVNNHVITASALYDGGPAAGLSAVTDNQSNSYSEDGDATGGGGASSATIYSCKVATSSGTYTITVDPTTASGLYIAWTAVEFSGLDGTTHKDKTGTNVSSSSTADASVTASVANSTADGVAIAASAISNADSDINIGDTPPSGYTNIQVNEDANSYMGFSSVYKIYSGSETSSAAWSHDNTSQSGWAAAIVTYKAAAGGGRTTKNKNSHPLGYAYGVGRKIVS